MRAEPKSRPPSAESLVVERLALCMIARDEEAQLPRALDSVAGVVDELVVLDTGSRDRTLEIARSRGARTASFAWCDDFAAARNAALELVSARWVLVLDADEELVGSDAREALRAFAARRAGSGLAGLVEIENLGASSGESRVLVSRFFELDGRTRFAGRVHEQLQRDGAPLARTPLGVRVRHHGYTQAALAGRDKLARNRRLLQRVLAESPDDGYAWFQLGRTEHVAGRHAQALAAFEQALARAGDSEPWAVVALESAAYSLRALGRSAQALAVCAEVEQRFSDRADTCFLLALLRLDVGDLGGAERGFLRALELGSGESIPGRGAAGLGESVRSASSSAPAFNLGLLREARGDRTGARAWYQRALELEPGLAAAREGLARLA